MKLTSRKFWLLVILQIVFVVMRYDGMLESGDFVDLTKWVWFSYIVGNVGEHATTKWKGGKLTAGGPD